MPPPIWNFWIHHLQGPTQTNFFFSFSSWNSTQPTGNTCKLFYRKIRSPSRVSLVSLIMEICDDSRIMPRPFHWDRIRCFFRLSIRPQTWGKTSVNPLPIASGLAAMSVRVLSRSSGDHWSVSVLPIDMHRKSPLLRILVNSWRSRKNHYSSPLTSSFSHWKLRKNWWVMWLGSFAQFFEKHGFIYLLEIRDVISFGENLEWRQGLRESQPLTYSIRIWALSVSHGFIHGLGPIVSKSVL